jgi:hypothetical protein
MNIVFETLTAYLPSKRKQTPSGWLSFNATCCVHNGHSADKKMRAGIIVGSDNNVSYSCFNCGYKASYTPGRTLSYKLRKLLEWLGAPDDVISKLSLHLLRESEGVESKTRIITIPKFEDKELPLGAVRLADCAFEENKYAVKLAQYMGKRGLYLDDYEFHWSPDIKFRNRLIIPFYYKQKIVGFTGRDVLGTSNTRYMSDQSPGYVFNLDSQQDDRDFMLIFEGPIDAIYFNAVALLGSEVKDEQALLINSVGKMPVVVPDRDNNGKHLAEYAMEQGWAVSLPEWGAGIDDAGAAVEKYGRMYTMYSIVSAATTSHIKIKLRMKKWFSG